MPATHDAVRGTSRAARDDKARHDVAQGASSRRPRRQFPVATRPSGNRDDDRAAAAANEVGGRGVCVGAVWVRQYVVLIVLSPKKEYRILIL